MIELLTTDDWTVALARATDCEHTNQERQKLCAQIEQQAIASIRKHPDRPGYHPQRDRILVLVREGWHHGVIGIVASRLVERFGVPVFIATYENDEKTEIRGSARGNPEFDVFEALQYCRESLDKFGGHRAAGGFSLSATQWSQLQTDLITFAHQTLEPETLKPLVTIDSQARFEQLGWDLFQGIDQLHPCGIGNREPVFWSESVEVIEQSVIGKQKNHLRLMLNQPDGNGEAVIFKAMAWRWGEYAPLPGRIDVAYRLRDNYWNGETTLELELLGYRASHGNHAIHQLDDVKATTRSSIPSQIEAKEYQNNLTIDWSCPEPPLSDAPSIPKEWLPLEEPLEQLIQNLSGHVLLYGYQCPEINSIPDSVELEYDRPTQSAETLILWTIPPSWSHLKWLLALAKSHRIYVRNDNPPMLNADELRSQLRTYIKAHSEESLNLLALGQEWWVAPSTIVSALREMGYPCSGFPTTVSLAQEFQRLRDWYQYPPHVIRNFG